MVHQSFRGSLGLEARLFSNWSVFHAHAPFQPSVAAHVSAGYSNTQGTQAKKEAIHISSAQSYGVANHVPSTTRQRFSLTLAQP